MSRHVKTSKDGKKMRSDVFLHNSHEPSESPFNTRAAVAYHHVGVVCPSVFAVQCASLGFSGFCLDWFTLILSVLPPRETESLREREREMCSCSGRCLKSQHVVWCLHCQCFIVHCSVSCHRCHWLFQEQLLAFLRRTLI